MTNNFDTEIIFFIYSKLHFPILDKVMIFISSLGDSGFIWIALALLLLVNKKTRMVGILTLAALLLNGLIGEVLLKSLFQRPRPYGDFPSTVLLIDKLISYSFPSGHTSSSFAAAYVLSRFFKKYALYLWGFAVLMGISRIYLFMHYPTDVMAGIILGIFCGMIVMFIYRKYLKEFNRGR